MIADDHGVLRDGLRCILSTQKDVSVVASAADGVGAVREIERHLPQVALLGLSMSGLGGIDAARIVVEKMPNVAIVILSGHASPMVVRRALDAGVLGYLSKDCTAEEVLKAVRTVVTGQRYLSRELGEKFLDLYRGAQRSEKAVEMLTGTERKILKLVSDGMSNPRVAEVLGLSPRTVETYRLRLMRKLQIEDLASLVKFAVRHGVTTLD